MPMVDAVILIQLRRLTAISVVYLSRRHLECLILAVCKTHRLAAALLDSIIRESVAPPLHLSVDNQCAMHVRQLIEELSMYFIRGYINMSGLVWSGLQCFYLYFANLMDK